MDKCDEAAFGPDPRLFVNKLHSLSLEPSERLSNVLDLNGDVMNAPAAFLKKLRDRRIVRRRFEQFDAAFADREHRHADLLIFDDLSMHILEPESVFPEFQRVLDAVCRNSQVIDLHKKRLPPSRQKIPRQTGGSFHLSVHQFFDSGIWINPFCRNLGRKTLQLFVRAVPLKQIGEQPLAKKFK